MRLRRVRRFILLCCVAYRSGGLRLFTNALRREASRDESGESANGNGRLFATMSPATASADRFRQLSVWLLLASALIALVMTLSLEMRVDPKGAAILECLNAALLLAALAPA